MLRRHVLVLSCFALLVAACGSSAPPEFSDPEVAGHTTNPDGVAYPTDHIGGKARVTGRVGDRMENFTFQGYEHGNLAAGLKTFSMADFYDPKATRVKGIVIQGAATWCTACAGEADIIAPLVPGLEKEGVVVLSVLTAGPSAGYGPQLSDVESWVTDHKANYTTLIDVRARRLASVGLTGVPWSALVDPRTMEILFAADGYPDDFTKFAHVATNFVMTHAPSY
jgi:thiol-disulfide isomerase/thioredoxin